MIAAAALLAIASQQPLRIHVEGDGRARPCLASIDGRKFNPMDEAAVARAFAPYPANQYRVAFIGDDAAGYRCIGMVIYQVQKAQYRLAGRAAAAAE